MKEHVMTREEIDVMWNKHFDKVTESVLHNVLHKMKEDKKTLNELVAKFPSLSHYDLDRLVEIGNSLIYRANNNN